VALPGAEGLSYFFKTAPLCTEHTTAPVLVRKPNGLAEGKLDRKHASIGKMKGYDGAASMDMKYLLTNACGPRQEQASGVDSWPFRSICSVSDMYTLMSTDPTPSPPPSHEPGGPAGGALTKGSKGCSHGTLFSRSCCNFRSFSSNASCSYLAMTLSMLA